jgi:hypothetical protein
MACGCHRVRGAVRHDGDKVAMACDSHRVHGTTRHNGDEVVMACDCYCVRATVSLDGHEAVQMVSSCHLAHGRVNPVLGDVEETATDAEHDSHLTNQNYCLNRTR